MQKTRKKMWLLGLLLITLMVAILILSILEQRMLEEQEQKALLDVPPGWMIFLKGENFMGMAEQGDILWGGGRNGVFKIDRQKAEVIEKMEFNQDVSYVTSLLIDNNDKLWVSYENGVVTWDGENFNYYNEDNVLPDNRANFVTQDSSGNIWVGTWGGAVCYDGNSWKVITTEDGLSVDMVNVIMEDGFGSIWFGAYNVRGGAVSIFKEGSWQYFSTENGLPNNNVTAFLELEKGTVWVGTGFYNRGGAARFVYQDGKYKIDRTMEIKDGLAGEKVRSLYHDNLGNLWFGSEFDGIAVMDDINLTVLTEEDGLSHNEVLSILQDDDGNIWLGTLDGITKIDYNAVNNIHNLK